MNNLKKIIGLVLVSALALVHFDSFAKNSAPMARAMGQGKELRVAEANVDAVIEAQTAQVQQVTADAEKVKMDAQAAIEAAQDDVAQGKISRAKAAVIIGEQKYAIKKADETLTQVTNEAAEKVAEAEGYLSRFVTGVKSWYYGPEEAREVARARVTQLEEDLLAVEDEYTELIKNARGNRNKSSLKAELEGIKVEFKNEIQKQNDIAEGRMSSQKFWRAVGVAGAVVGSAAAYGAYRYFGGEALPPVSVPGALEPKTEDTSEGVKYDIPPTMKEIKANIQNTASDIYQAGQQGITALSERAEGIRTQLPTSAEGQIAIGQGKYKQAQANLATQQAKINEANAEYTRIEEERAAREAERQQKIADLKAEEDARIAAREQHKKDLEAKRQQAANRNKTPGQLKRDAEKAKQQEEAGSGLRGFAAKRTENARSIKNSRELESTQASINALEKNRVTKQEALTKQQVQLDTLQADLNKLEKGSPARMKKELEMLKQSGKVSTATKQRDDVDARLKFYRDKAAELQE